MVSTGGPSVDGTTLDSNFRDLAPIDLIKEVRKDYLWLASLLPAEQIKQQQKHQAQHQPESDAARKLVHALQDGSMRLLLQATDELTAKRKTWRVSGVSSATLPRAIPGNQAMSEPITTIGNIAR